MKRTSRYRMAPLLMAVVFACLSGPASADTLHRGNGAEAETLDPHKAMSVASGNILRDLYEGLVATAPDGSLIPGAAASWERSDDGLHYVFHLRANGRWSNGDPVTAADFVTGFRRSLDPATGSYYAQMLSVIDGAAAVLRGEAEPEHIGVEAVGERELHIRLAHPAPYLLGLLTHATTYPVHRPSLDAHGDAFARAGRKVSNGAFRLSNRVVQSHVALERNPYFHDTDNVRLQRVVYHTTEDINAELSRYRAGELHWTADVPVTQMRWVRDNAPEHFHAHPYLGTYYYGFNTTRPPFADQPGLRRALAMVVDRRRIAEHIVGTGEAPAWSFVPGGTENYTPQRPEWADWPMDKRLERARALYAEAGYDADNPLVVELRYNTHENHRKIAIAVAWMWREALGVRTRLLNEEFKVFLANRRMRQETEVFRAGWIGDYNDAFTFLEILHSGHGMNDTGYRSADFDALLERARHEADSEARRELLQAAERQLLEDMPVLPMYFYTSRRLVRPELVGWQGNVMDQQPSRYMYFAAPERQR